MSRALGVIQPGRHESRDWQLRLDGAYLGCSPGGVRANSAGAFIIRELGVIQPGWHESRISQLL